jgi:hypothetical protein
VSGGPKSETVTNREVLKNKKLLELSQRFYRGLAENDAISVVIIWFIITFKLTARTSISCMNDRTGNIVVGRMFFIIAIMSLFWLI